MNLETIIRHYIDQVYCTHEFRIITINKYMDGVITFNVRFRRKNIVMREPKHLRIKLVYFGTCLIGFETHENYLEEIKNLLHDNRKN